jgi:hypothetical protein
LALQMTQRLVVAQAEAASAQGRVGQLQVHNLQVRPDVLISLVRVRSRISLMAWVCGGGLCSWRGRWE